MLPLRNTWPRSKLMLRQFKKPLKLLVTSTCPTFKLLRLLLKLQLPEPKPLLLSTTLSKPQHLQPKRKLMQQRQQTQLLSLLQKVQLLRLRLHKKPLSLVARPRDTRRLKQPPRQRWTRMLQTKLPPLRLPPPMLPRLLSAKTEETTPCAASQTRPRAKLKSQDQSAPRPTAAELPKNS